MTLDMIVVFAVLAGALALMVTDALRVDLVALLVVLALVVTGVLRSDRAFRGFGSEVVVFLAGLFVLSGALVRTGIVDQVGLAFLRRFGGRPERIAGASVVASSALSAFLSNTITVSLFVPLVGRLARRGGPSPTRVLMPMAFATLLGGTCTLVGTSTNVVASGQLVELGHPPLGLFETAAVGLPAVGVGLAYLLLVAPRLLERRRAAEATVEAEGRPFMAELEVAGGSPWDGKTLSAVRPRDAGVEVIALVRGGGELRLPGADELLHAGDVLVARGTTQDILGLAGASGLRTVAGTGREGLRARDLALAEVLVAPGSFLVGLTLKEARFRQRFEAVVVGIWRKGHPLTAKVGRVRLRVGDVLLVEGPGPRVRALADDADLLLLDDVSHHRSRRGHRWAALALFVLTLVIGSLTGEFAAAALGGAALAVALGCVTAEEAYESLDWRLLVLVGGMLALGTAMTETGAAAFVAEGIVGLAAPLGPRGVIAALFVLTTVLTQPMSNNAAALVVLPVALAAAGPAGLPARQLAIAVTIAASCSFVTPLEPATLLVYGPGRYRFADFVRVGAPLAAIVGVLTVIIVPIAWP